MDLHTVEALVPATGPGDVGPGDAWLAGGTQLFSAPHRHLRRLVDLTALRWEPLVEDAAGLHVAATCTVRQLAAWGAASAGRHRAAVLVGQCADAFLAGWKVQGQATVGGNTATALPAAPVVSLAASLDGVALLQGRPAGQQGVRERRVPVAQLVTGDGRTALAPGELIRSVLLPASSLAARTAFRRASLTPLGRSASLVVARRDPDGRVVLTLTAAVGAPLQLRWPDLTAAGGPGAVAAALDDAVAAAAAADPGRGWFDDVHGMPAWRRAVAMRHAGEAVAELAGATGALTGGGPADPVAP